MCDITIAADDATIFDLHYDIGSVPADGIQQLLPGAPRRQRPLRPAHRRGDHRAPGARMGHGQRGPPARGTDRAGLRDRRPHHDPAAHGPPPHHADRAPPVEAANRRRPRRGLRIQMFGHIAKKRAVHGQEHIRSTSTTSARAARTTSTNPKRSRAAAPPPLTARLRTRGRAGSKTGTRTCRRGRG